MNQPTGDQLTDHPSGKRGNDAKAWNTLLKVLDERLHLWLLDHLKKATSYHFEEEILTIQPASMESLEYMTQPAVLKQLELFAEEVLSIEKVKVTDPE